jgi:hypothetical protein
MCELKKQVVVCLLIFWMPLGGSDLSTPPPTLVSLARRKRKPKKNDRGGVRPSHDTSELRTNNILFFCMSFAGGRLQHVIADQQR